MKLHPVDSYQIRRFTANNEQMSVNFCVGAR
jgi:hypothetical protein